MGQNPCYESDRPHHIPAYSNYIPRYSHQVVACTHRNCIQVPALLMWTKEAKIHQDFVSVIPRHGAAWVGSHVAGLRGGDCFVVVFLAAKPLQPLVATIRLGMWDSTWDRRLRNSWLVPDISQTVWWGFPKFLWIIFPELPDILCVSPLVQQITVNILGLMASVFFNPPHGGFPKWVYPQSSSILDSDFPWKKPTILRGSPYEYGNYLLELCQSRAVRIHGHRWGSSSTRRWTAQGSAGRCAPPTWSLPSGRS